MKSTKRKYIIKSVDYGVFTKYSHVFSESFLVFPIPFRGCFPISRNGYFHLRNIWSVTNTLARKLMKNDIFDIDLTLAFEIKVRRYLKKK